MTLADLDLELQFLPFEFEAAVLIRISALDRKRGRFSRSGRLEERTQNCPGLLAQNRCVTAAWMVEVARGPMGTRSPLLHRIPLLDTLSTRSTLLCFVCGSPRLCSEIASPQHDSCSTHSTLASTDQVDVTSHLNKVKDSKSERSLSMCMYNGARSRRFGTLTVWGRHTPMRPRVHNE